MPPPPCQIGLIAVMLMTYSRARALELRIITRKMIKHHSNREQTLDNVSHSENLHPHPREKKVEQKAASLGSGKLRIPGGRWGMVRLGID